MGGIKSNAQRIVNLIANIIVCYLVKTGKRVDENKK